MSKWIFSLFFILWLVPQTVQAFGYKGDDVAVKTWQKVNTVVDSKSEEVKYVVFGILMKIAGICGIAFGAIQTALQASPQPLIRYGGTGFLIVIVPFFIDTLFGAVVPGI